MDNEIYEQPVKVVINHRGAYITPPDEGIPCYAIVGEGIHQIKWQNNKTLPLNDQVFVCMAAAKAGLVRLRALRWMQKRIGQYGWRSLHQTHGVHIMLQPHSQLEHQYMPIPTGLMAEDEDTAKSIKFAITNEELKAFAYVYIDRTTTRL